MTEELQTPALEAGDEVVSDQQDETNAGGEDQDTSETEGQETDQPAEADDAEEQKSKSAERRERRKQAMERLQASEAEAQKRAREHEAKLKAAREAAKALPKPKQQDFQDFDEYQARLAAYHSLQALDDRQVRQLEEEGKRYFEEVTAIRRQQEAEDAQHWAAQREEARKRYPDFDKVALQDAPVDERMAKMIVQSDVAAEIAYHIGKNPQFGRDLSRMSDVQMARALGALEAQLSAPQQRKPSSAPEPITPVRGKATPSKDPDRMTPAEYREWRMNGGSF